MIDRDGNPLMNCSNANLQPRTRPRLRPLQTGAPLKLNTAAMYKMNTSQKMTRHEEYEEALTTMAGLAYEVHICRRIIDQLSDELNISAEDLYKATGISPGNVRRAAQRRIRRDRQIAMFSPSKNCEDETILVISKDTRASLNSLNMQFSALGVPFEHSGSGRVQQSMFDLFAVNMSEFIDDIKKHQWWGKLDDPGKKNMLLAFDKIGVLWECISVEAKTRRKPPPESSASADSDASKQSTPSPTPNERIQKEKATDVTSVIAHKDDDESVGTHGLVEKIEEKGAGGNGGTEEEEPTEEDDEPPEIVLPTQIQTKIQDTKVGGLYCFEIPCISVSVVEYQGTVTPPAVDDIWCLVKLGMTTKPFLKRLTDEFNDMKNWRAKHPADIGVDDAQKNLLWLAEGLQHVGHEKHLRRRLGLQVGTEGVLRRGDHVNQKTLATMTKAYKTETWDSLVMANGRFKAGTGWTLWLREKGKTCIGPTELVIMNKVDLMAMRNAIHCGTFNPYTWKSGTHGRVITMPKTVELNWASPIVAQKGMGALRFTFAEK